jgi:hypothetical protein
MLLLRSEPWISLPLYVLPVRIKRLEKQIHHEYSCQSEHLYSAHRHIASDRNMQADWSSLTWSNTVREVCASIESSRRCYTGQSPLMQGYRLARSCLLYGLSVAKLTECSTATQGEPRRKSLHCHGCPLLIGTCKLATRVAQKSSYSLCCTMQKEHTWPGGENAGTHLAHTWNGWECALSIKCEPCEYI